jgi:hypothetical protein
LFVFGLWGLVAPYLSTAAGYPIPVPARVEFVDHVIPGIIILGVAIFAMFSGRLPLVPALAATLSAFWMTLTHLPALRDGFRGVISMQAALIHSVPGIAILALAGLAAVRGYRAMPD